MQDMYHNLSESSSHSKVLNMAQSIGLNSPNSYRLISAVISNNEGNQIDVSNLVDSFQITESIYQMFLTGSIVIADNINVFNRLNFT